MQYTLARAVDALAQKAAAGQDDAKLHYELAVLLINLHGCTCETEHLQRARQHLQRATGMRPRLARAHAALGYACDLDRDVAGAIASFRTAHRLAPDNDVYEAYLFRMLAADRQEAEALAAIEAAGARRDVDVAKLRRDLGQAGFGVNAANLFQAFVHAPNFLKSSLEDEAERIQKALAPGRARAQATAERKRCVANQQALERSFDASRVPEPIRTLAPWAARHGLGDDGCRSYLLRRLPKKQLAALVRDVDTHAPAIHAWLDSFGDAVMPTEATAYMYLALGVEDVR